MKASLSAEKFLAENGCQSTFSANCICRI